MTLANAGREAETEASQRTAIRLLLVDDDLDVLGSNSRFLRLNGCEVHVADSGPAALARLDNQEVDLVITDLRMDQGGGLAFARELRIQRPLMPIVFYSGYARVPDVVAAMRLGASDFLEKPVEPDVLLATVRALGPGEANNRPRHAFTLDDEPMPFRQRVLAFERHLIETSLARHDGRIVDVLEELHISRRTLNDKMARLGIQRTSGNLSPE